jgi:hypothetical protein
MVTAAAHVLADSHALPQPAAGTNVSSASSPASFRSIYQSLPLLPADPGPEISSSKGLASKRNSPKAADNHLLAPVSVPASGSPPPRPWAPALPTSPWAAPRTTAEPEPASASDSDLAQKAVDVRESSLVASTQIGTSSLMTYGAASSRPGALNASVNDAAPTHEMAQLSMSGRSLPSDIEPSAPPPSHDGISNLLQPGVAVPSNVSASATNPKSEVAPREPASNSLAPASTPSFLLGAPSTPGMTDGAQVETAKSPKTGAAPQSGVQPGLFTKGLTEGLAATTAPQSGNLAFSLKMVESNSVARQAQQALQPQPADRNQAPSPTKGESHNSEAPLASSATHATSTQANVASDVAAAAPASATVNPILSQAAVTPQLNAHVDTQFSEPQPPANISAVAALHEAQPVLPEAPRATAASEILLQLGGKDQAAAIRVSDRAGTVNVSVHATDGDLRSSLRSNLGDLATQLTHQGWKTEVVKAGTSLTRGETSQDPQQDGQRSPGQQQGSSQGDRQPQRDRRASSGHWQAEFEEQTSANSGGKN